MSTCHLTARAVAHYLPRTINPSHLLPRHRSRSVLALFSRRTFVAASISVSASPMASSAKKVLVPVANGTEPIEAVVVVDVLRRAGADVTVASVEKQLRVEATWGLKLVADALLADVAEAAFDLVTLPGGAAGANSLRDCAALEQLLKKHAAEGKLYSAVCASPAVVLGSWGLLKGLRATCYPSFMDKLPSDVTPVESRVQVDGNVVTSRGPGTTMEFAVALVEQLYGKDKAQEVATPLVMWPQHGAEFNMSEFNPVEWKSGNPPKILVPIANGSEEMEAIMIIDVLRRGGCNVVVASVEIALIINASRKVQIEADMLIEEAAKLQYDLVVLPGGLPGAKTFSNTEALINLLKKQANSNQLYGAICASPALVLEPHGLLKGKKATAFPAMCDKLSDQTAVENRVVVDGNVITSRGPGTSMEFALSIIEKLCGREKALEVAKGLLVT